MNNELIEPNDIDQIRKTLRKARHIIIQTEFGTGVKVPKTACLKWLDQLESRNIIPTYETTPLWNGILVVFRSPK